MSENRLLVFSIIYNKQDWCDSLFMIIMTDLKVRTVLISTDNYDIGTSVVFDKRVTGKIKWPLFPWFNFIFFVRLLLFYQNERCYSAMGLEFCMQCEH